MEQPAPSDETPPSSPLPAEAPATEPAAPEGELPEWEPLSPELLEDEAIRGDFVLRWAIVGLAMLFGWHRRPAGILVSFEMPRRQVLASVAQGVNGTHVSDLGRSDDMNQLLPLERLQ